MRFFSVLFARHFMRLKNVHKLPIDTIKFGETDLGKTNIPNH